MTDKTVTQAGDCPDCAEYRGLWRYAERRADRWRGIASAMGYEPRAHANVRPTEQWTLDRIARFRKAVAAEEALAAHRLASQTDAHMAAPDDERRVEHIAHILEKWDMTPPPNDFTGHDYKDIARDIIASLSASNAMRDALTKARQELYLLSLSEGTRDHEIGVLITQIDAALAGQGTTLDRQTAEHCAKIATSFLVGDPANGVPLRSPTPHEIADRIRASMDQSHVQ